MARHGVTFKIPERYEYQGKTLEGGQGYVHIYRDSFLDRPVAIKEMKQIRDAEVLRDELARIREVRSRHVIEVYDLLRSKRTPRVALVEEYVPGVTLRELSTTISTEAAALRLLWQMASGLVDVHNHGIVHRDFNPNNIKRDSEGIIKILDFGLSAVEAPDTQTIAARGTVHYLAPEMYETPTQIETTLDVYAFGVCAWYLLNKGKLPQPLKQTPPQSWKAAPSLETAEIQLAARVTTLLDAAVNPDPAARPEMTTIQQVLDSELTAGQHQLCIVHGSERQVVNAQKRHVVLRVGEAFVKIHYDRFEFRITDCGGDVYLNNTSIASGTAIPGACVLTFGGGHLGPFRTFVPMAVVNPEVVL